MEKKPQNTAVSRNEDPAPQGSKRPDERSFSIPILAGCTVGAGFDTLAK